MSILDAACQFDQPVTCHPGNQERQIFPKSGEGKEKRKKMKRWNKKTMGVSLDIEPIGFNCQVGLGFGGRWVDLQFAIFP
jgi:hypothetical protein